MTSRVANRSVEMEFELKPKLVIIKERLAAYLATNLTLDSVVLETLTRFLFVREYAEMA